MEEANAEKRPPREVWAKLRRGIWERDGGLCQYPHGPHPVALDAAHINHIISGKRGSNARSTLRTLCRNHHLLRVDMRHRGKIARALRDGIIGANWRTEGCGTGDTIRASGRGTATCVSMARTIRRWVRGAAA